MSDAFDLSTTYVHLGLPARAELLPDFQWTPEYLDAYRERVASDGDGGRLVSYFHQDASWDTWERHPAGDELVVLVSGRADLFQEIDGEVRKVELTPGMAVVNPPGVWHTADIHEPGDALFITPGLGTEVRPR
jgi:mannose-6-phosphate isomerase-like protein (cupin superfamily)